MPKALAPAKNTGGGGFEFENKVCAWFLAHMLVDQPPLGVEVGRLKSIGFQCRPEGWLMDDLLLTLVGDDGTQHKCELSMKSNVQFSDSAAPSDFVRAAWEQVLGEVSPSPFQLDTDFMGLITAPLHQDLKKSLETLICLAQAEIPERFTLPRWTNSQVRSLAASFAVPSDLAEKYKVDANAVGSLLPRLRFQQFDFENTPSQDNTSAVELCRRSLRSGELQEAVTLWSALIRIAAECRPKAGVISRNQLLNTLRGSFKLVDLPHHREDWARLDTFTKACIKQVRDCIGNDLHLERNSIIQEIRKKLAETAYVAVVGSSGIGKSSSVAKYALEIIEEGNKCLWFDANSFDRQDYIALESALRLAHPLSELAHVPDEFSLLVLDGLDRLYDEKSFLIIATLISLVDAGHEDSPWRVIVTCQTQEWSRVIQQLVRATSRMWSVLQCEPLPPEDLEPVWQAIPKLAHLKRNPKLLSLMSNLKILDLVASRILNGGDVEASEWVGESSVAEWFWESQISSGSERLVRERCAMRLATYQAQTLTASISYNEFDPSELSALEGLVQGHICRRDGMKVAFDHDLFGDWARFKAIISESSDIVTFMSERLGSPLWHRAFRLYGVHLLERSDLLSTWIELLDKFEQRGIPDASDLLLESLIFAVDPLNVLARVNLHLLADKGKLVKRLIGRFLAFATLPHPVYVEVARIHGMDPVKAAVTWRYPNWPYWSYMLDFLYENREAVIDVASPEVARVVELYLTYTQANTPLKQKAAELALMVGEKAAQCKYGVDKVCYKATFLGAFTFPDRVSDWALMVSHRDFATERTSDLVGRPINEYPWDEQPAEEPWPDGPREEINSEFRRVVLDSVAISPLIRVRPEIAREVILACLIEVRMKPTNSSYSRIRNHSCGLNYWIGWNPTNYNDGPFLAFLKINYEEGLETIARLVDFATERHMEESGINWTNDELVSLDGHRTLLGGGDVYGWSAGLGAAPKFVMASLMALEYYLYEEMAEGRKIDDKIEAIIRRVRSTAFAGVLCNVGKKEVSLFEGVLQPLLGIHEIYEWDITSNVYGRSHFMIGAALKGFARAKEINNFHNQDHRLADLREVAAKLFLSRENTREYLNLKREAWERHTDKPGNLLEQLIIEFNIDNYDVAEQDNGLLYINRRAVEWQKDKDKEIEAINARSMLLTIPLRCRQIIDDKQALGEEELDRLWDDLQVVLPFGKPHKQEEVGEKKLKKLAGVLQHWRKFLRLSDQPPQGVDESSRNKNEYDMDTFERVASCIAGTAAVLLSADEVWLNKHPDRQAWMVNSLRDIIVCPPKSHILDSEHSVCNWTWDYFAAEVLPQLWATSPQNIELRSLAARLVLLHHYGAIETFFTRCFERRAILGEDFSRLRRLAFEWAHVRNRMKFMQDLRGSLHPREFMHFQRKVNAWMRDRINAFMEGKLPSAVQDWHEMDHTKPFKKLDKLIVNRLTHYPLDLSVIQSSHAWVTNIDQAVSDVEKNEWVDFLDSALSHIMTFINQNNEESTPLYEDCIWILDYISKAIHVVDEGDHLKRLWQPILRLPKTANYWIEHFLQEFHRIGLTSNPTPPYFVELRNAFFDCLQSTSLDRFYISDAWQALVGLDSLSRTYWEPRHTRIVEQSRDLIQRWVEQGGQYGGNLGALASWLISDAAVPNRLVGITWIEKRLLDVEGTYAKESSVNPIASLLCIIWGDDEENLRKDPNAFRAFQRLHRWLIQRQSPQAMELLKTVGEL